MTNTEKTVFAALFGIIMLMLVISLALSGICLVRVSSQSSPHHVPVPDTYTPHVRPYNDNGRCSPDCPCCGRRLGDLEPTSTPKGAK